MFGLLRCNLSACDPAVKEAAYLYMYMSLDRPLIEYASSACDPHNEHRHPKLSVSMADKNIRICMGIPIKSLRR